MTSGWVTVSGSPAASCRLKSGITLPSEPSTLPKRTARKSVRLFASAGHPSTTCSAMRLVAPITLEGCTALSVEISTNFSAPKRAAHSATERVPSTLLRTASTTLLSISGTCLYAAAWNTNSGR